MEADRRVEVLSRRPEFIVVAGMEGKVRMRRLPDDRALQPRLTTAFQFFDSVFNVVNRNRGNTDQAIGIDAAIIDEPVVVNAKARLLESGIIERKQIEHQ